MTNINPKAIEASKIHPDTIDNIIPVSIVTGQHGWRLLQFGGEHTSRRHTAIGSSLPITGPTYPDT